MSSVSTPTLTAWAANSTGRVFNKLGLRDGAQAVVVAYETGLVTLGVES